MTALDQPSGCQNLSIDHRTSSKGSIKNTNIEDGVIFAECPIIEATLRHAANDGHLTTFHQWVLFVTLT